LIILSKNSVKSQWVTRELNAGLAEDVLSEPTPGRIAFNWYKFAQEKRGRYDGKRTHVFFGKRFKSEPLARRRDD
jgi:hypothetical protein